jgi:hypothetical protein
MRIFKLRIGKFSQVQATRYVADDSAHRIGQKKEVRVLRLISSNTVEELVLARAQKKLEIDGKVIQAGKFDDVTTGAEYEALLVGLDPLTLPCCAARYARQAKQADTPGESIRE